METRAQTGGSGTQPLLQARRDPDPRDFPAQPAHILSLDQIRAIRSTNEYTEGPTVAPRPGAKPSPRTASTQHKNQHNHRLSEQRPLPRSQPPACPRPPLARSTSTGSSSTRTSMSSGSSEQRLLGSPVSSSGHFSDQVIRVQPKGGELKSDELKPPIRPDPGAHAYRCEVCGKCKCQECTCPRRLPSCWVCDKQCQCSAQSVLDYGTCVCCVKGLLYHCSTDDEDDCFDKPCSCSQAHCCARWSAMGLLSLLLPCLCCYLPAKGCLLLCQGCHDRLHRPGCRCKHSNTVCCKVPSVPPRTPEKPT